MKIIQSLVTKKLNVNFIACTYTGFLALAFLFLITFHEMRKLYSSKNKNMHPAVDSFKKAMQQALDFTYLFSCVFL